MIRGEFATNWWARRWIAALEAFGWDERLRRGRAYARSGHVVSVDIQPGRVQARVKGSRPRPYAVSIELPVLTEAAWEQVLAALAGQARYAASLLAGEMPQTIEEVFEQAGTRLMPSPEEPLETQCSCPDWARPCKHIAAVHYTLGSEFDRDPFLIFRLRGRTREAVVADLRARRSAAADPQPAAAAPAIEAQRPGLDSLLDGFWATGAELAELRFSIAGPRVPEAVLKRLGSPLPSFEGELPRTELARLYRVISERAIKSALEDDAPPGTPDSRPAH